MSHTPVEVWSAVLNVMGALGPHILPARRQAVQELGLTGHPSGMLIHAHDFQPLPISPERMRRCVPHYNPQVWADGLADLAAQGWLEPVGQAEYRLTDTGRATAEAYLGRIRAALVNVRPLPQAHVERLADLLWRVVDASLATADVSNRACLDLQCGQDPGPGASPLVCVLQYGSDLYSFRCDAHRAAWHDHAIDGAAWEAFTLLWRGEATSPQSLEDQLWPTTPTRGYRAADYARMLDDLIHRGWVEADTATAGAVRVTSQGNAVRQAAEDTTDRFFYAPWSVLSGSELVELNELCQWVAAGLTLEQRLPQARAAWEATHSVLYAMDTAYTPAVEAAITATGLHGPWGSIMHALYHDHEPVPIDAPSSHIHFVFANPRQMEDNLAWLAHKGLLTPLAGAHAYRLTPRGLDTARQVHAAIVGALSEAESRLAVDIDGYLALFRRIYDAMWATTEPPKDCLHAYMQLPLLDAGRLVWLRSAIFHLRGFRDDCQNAAWRATGLRATAYDALTVLIAGEAATVADVAAKLASRGYDEAVYAEAVVELVAGGWVTEDGEGGYRVTEGGKSLRAEAEARHERLFLAPWATLDDAELEAYLALTQALAHSLSSL